MISKSIKAKRRRNATYYRLTKTVQVEMVAPTAFGNRYSISMEDPKSKNLACFVQFTGEDIFRSRYGSMLDIARTMAYRLDVETSYEKRYNRAQAIIEAARRNLR